jgi:hypothetical protein
MLKDSWSKEENKHKRPNNNKRTGEQGAAAVEKGSKGEFLLCTVCFPTAPDVSNDPGVWIGDAGATAHMSLHKNGIANVRKGSKEDAATVGNKQVE